jgi:hypothetical protein
MKCGVEKESFTPNPGGVQFSVRFWGMFCILPCTHFHDASPQMIKHMVVKGFSADLN